MKRAVSGCNTVRPTQKVRNTSRSVSRPLPQVLCIEIRDSLGGDRLDLASTGSPPHCSSIQATVAQRNTPNIPLAQADLNHELPLKRRIFDAVLCALVGEHLTNLPLTFRELLASLAPGGRLVFSVFHPEMAAVGIEANFERCGVEYRLGAYRYTVDDYLNVIEDCGFRDVKCYEFYGDDELVNEVPWATKYLGRSLLLIIEARKQT